MDANVPQRARLGGLRALLLAGAMAFAPHAFAAVGALDVSFGIHGRVVAAEAVMPSATLGLRDGGVLLAVRPAPVFQRLAFVRLQRDGQPDRSFGTQGVLEPPAGALPPFGAQLPLVEAREGFIGAIGGDKLQVFHVTWTGAVRSIELDIRSLCPGRAYADHEVARFATLPDGRILLVGSLTLRSDFLGNPLLDACAFVVALRPDGTLDTGFGSEGRFAHAAPTSPRFSQALAAFPDREGRIHLVGRYASEQTRMHFYVARMSSQGRLDAAFGTAGVAAFDLEWSPFCHLQVAGGFDRFYIAGACQRFSDPYQLYLARFRMDGTRETSYVPGEVASSNLSGFMPYHMALQADGSLLLAGSHDPGRDMGLMRIDSQGRIDASLGAAGHAVYPGGMAESIWLRPSVQPDGNVLFVARETVEMIAAPTDNGPIAVLRVKGLPPVVEFHNALLDHYFYALDGEEAHGIDQGAAGPGWSRTGFSFEAGGPDALCRFYGTPGIGSNSHFFTAEPGECELVRRDPGWSYEGTGFQVTRLHPQLGCQRGTREVLRIYNNRAAARDSNHRFVTDFTVVPVMQARGWVVEAPVFCVPIPG